MQRTYFWLHEILYGLEEARDLLSLENPFPTQLITDAMDVFQTLQCSRPYMGAGESLCTYLECLREDMLQGKLEEFCWVPTGSMLADGGSKILPKDELAQRLLQTGAWKPTEYKLLVRSSMDGADAAGQFF